MINLPVSYSKINQFFDCPMKYGHAYIFRTKVDEPLQYPLVLGTLSHLFTELHKYHNYSLKDILNLKNDLDKLVTYIQLFYMGYDYKLNKFSYNEMNLEINRIKYIKFIEDNEVVFFHAIKLFKIYLEKFLPRIDACDDNHIELIFNKVESINDNFNVGFYGSIDSVFYKFIEHVMHLYIGDFKTGKKLYDHYIKQLYFYLHNIKEYVAPDVNNCKDNVNELLKLKEITNDKRNEIYLILFNFREGVYERKTFREVEDDYNEYIDTLYKTLNNDIYYLHSEKDLTMDKIFNKFEGHKNYVNATDIDKEEYNITCVFCKFKEHCIKRIKRT